MAASIRIEDEAFSDARMALLAELAGYANHYEALGRMAHLWRLCTQRQQHSVSEAMVRACLGPAGPLAVVGAELAERLDDGTYRVRGTAGRIEWLGQVRESSAAGGRARAAAASRAGGRFTSATSRPAGETPAIASLGPAENPADSSAPAPAPAPVLISLSSEPSGSREDLAAQKPRRKPETPLPDDWAPAPDVAVPSGVQLSAEVVRFRNNARQNDRRCRDWDAAFRNWLLKAGEFSRSRPGAAHTTGIRRIPFAT